jgi:hypothetical protein
MSVPPNMNEMVVWTCDMGVILNVWISDLCGNRLSNNVKSYKGNNLAECETTWQSYRI